jgi:hypothetical protein
VIQGITAVIDVTQITDQRKLMLCRLKEINSTAGTVPRDCERKTRVRAGAVLLLSGVILRSDSGVVPWACFSGSLQIRFVLSEFPGFGSQIS